MIQMAPHVAPSLDRLVGGSGVVEVASAAGGVRAAHGPLAGQMRQMLHVGELDLPLPGAVSAGRARSAAQPQ